VYTPVWRQAVDRVRGWMDEIGLQTRLDAVGNLYGRLEGREPGPVVLTGSHVDTVVHGGMYDGALGVHASLAAVKALAQAHGQPRRALEILVVCDEEGGRFRTDFWGARAVAGGLTPAEAEAKRDADGMSLAEAMRAAGFDPARVGEARRDDVAAWLELHIEQGGTLEAEGVYVGVVHTITGHAQRWVRVHGRQDHAGTTPMDVRRDPMVAAAEMIHRAIELAERMGRPSVCTVGRVDARPGAFNVVPELVGFSLDIRDADDARLAQLTGGVADICRDVAARRGLSVEVEQIMDRQPAPLTPALRSLLEDAAGRAGLKWKRLPSMAGHDTEVMVERWPSAMLFVPSHDGRSHTPAEFTPVEQVVPGVRVLAAALHHLAYA
jgi:allantoate deiminase